VFLMENCRQIQVTPEELLPTFHRRDIVTLREQCVGHSADSTSINTEEQEEELVFRRLSLEVFRDSFIYPV